MIIPVENIREKQSQWQDTGTEMRERNEEITADF